LAEFLNIGQWVTYKQFTLGFFSFNSQVKNFYNKKEQYFNLRLYPAFCKFFSNQQTLTKTEIQAYLLTKEVRHQH
jgi:hypothetical protein